MLFLLVILGAAAGVVIFVFHSSARTSAVSTCDNDAKAVESAVSAYYTALGAWPTTTAELTTSANGGPYLPVFQENPHYYAITVDPAGNGAVEVALRSTDAGAVDEGPSPASTVVGTTPENYDTFTYTNGFAGQNICAGV